MSDEHAMHRPQPASAYFLDDRKQASETHTLCVVVDNEPGVLARVIGLFSGRGYNIDSLTVSETEHDAHVSRITIVTTGTPNVIVQIKASARAHGAGAFGRRSHRPGQCDRARAGDGEGGGEGREARRGACGLPMRSAPASSMRRPKASSSS